MPQPVGDGCVVVEVDTLAPDVATAADEGNVEGFSTARGHCRLGEREGKSEEEDY